MGKKEDTMGMRHISEGHGAADSLRGSFGRWMKSHMSRYLWAASLSMTSSEGLKEQDLVPADIVA